MLTLDSLDQLARRKQEGPLLVLFGGVRCTVCQSIRPRLQRLMEERFPEIGFAYVECEQSRELCAQQGVFSLPVLKLFIEGELQLELARNFSLGEVERQIDRRYGLWLASRDEM